MSITPSDSRNIDLLINFIEQKKLTPVLGKELYKYSGKDDLLPIEDLLSAKLLEMHDSADQLLPSLTATINYLIKEKEQDKDFIVQDLLSIIQKNPLQLPLLTEFLKVDGLNYYINTIIYSNYLESSIEMIRKKKPAYIDFSLKAEKNSDSGDSEKYQDPFIFNVFGSLQNTIDPALSEEDMMEFVGSFKERLEKFNCLNIINTLKNRPLLFIGCAFPDWMVRFFLRLLSMSPMNEWANRKIFVVNDSTEKIHLNFLKKYKVIQFDMNTGDFINELVERWQSKNPQKISPKKIFLSYSSADQEAAETLKSKIEAIGNIECWYDNEKLNAGDEYEPKIYDNLQNADLCIPLISANSLNFVNSFVQQEWVTAYNKSIVKKDFLMPVIIDETTRRDEKITRYFSKFTFGIIPMGDPDPQFIQLIKETLHLS